MTIAPVESPPRAGEPAPRFGLEASAMARRAGRVCDPPTSQGLTHVNSDAPCNNVFTSGRRSMDEGVPKPNYRSSSTFVLVVVRLFNTGSSLKIILSTSALCFEVLLAQRLPHNDPRLAHAIPGGVDSRAATRGDPYPPWKMHTRGTSKMCVPSHRRRARSRSVAVAPSRTFNRLDRPSPLASLAARPRPTPLPLSLPDPTVPRLLAIPRPTRRSSRTSPWTLASVCPSATRTPPGADTAPTRCPPNPARPSGSSS